MLWNRLDIATLLTASSLITFLLPFTKWKTEMGCSELACKNEMPLFSWRDSFKRLALSDGLYMAITFSESKI